MIRKLWLVLAALVLLAGCASTQTGINALPPTADPATALARITYRDGTVENIAQEQLEALRPGARLLFQGDPPPEALLEYLLSRKLMLYLARTTDTTVAPEELEQVITNITEGELCTQAVQRTNQDNRAFFDECARAYGFADGTAFRNFIAEELTIGEVSAAEAPKDLIRPAHILTQNYEQAALAYDRVIANPARFGEVANEVSIDPGSRGEGGVLPAINEQGFTEDGQQFVPVFVTNTLALRPEFEQGGDAISEPFLAETEVYSGWHIVRIVGLEASQESAGQFRQDVYERALNAQTDDLNEPDTGDAPLVGVVEVLANFPTPEALPSVEPLPTVVPEETATTDEETVLPAATPETEGTSGADSAAPAESAPPEATATP